MGGAGTGEAEVTAHTNILAGDGDDEFRGSVVGASEVSALFDASPYLTHFELWHRKAGTIAVPEFGGNERIEAGIRLEPVIIDWACDKWGYTKAPTPKRLRCPTDIGGHPDQFVTCPDRGQGLLEVKTADWLVAKGWGDEPPLHYQLQAVTYMGLAGLAWADIVILVGGNELRRFQIEARPKLWAEIQKRAAEFWQSVRDGNPPRPDYSRDGDAIREINSAPGDTLIDLRGDNLAAIAAAEYHVGKAEEKAGKARAEAALAELVDKMGEHGTALLDGFTFKATRIAAIPDREAEPGEIIKGRKAYCRYTCKEMKA
jgi:predicted phage-related endonuclease